MPIVTLQIWEGHSVERKRAIVEGFTRVLQEVADIPPAAVHVVIQDVPRTNWGANGQLASDGAAGAE